MFVVDTNVLVYAADEDSPFHRRCRDMVNDWRRGAAAWYVTWGILYEFLRITTHPRVLRNPWPAAEAWRFVEAIVAAPALGVLVATERHSRVAAEVFAEIPHIAGNLMYDARTAILMREHGVSSIYTRDTDFHRFPFLKTIDPVT